MEGDRMFDLIPTLSAVVIVAGFFGLILLILWVALPFSVFGIKPLMRQMIERLDKLNDRLEQIERTVAEKRIDVDDMEVDIDPAPRRLVSGRK